MEQIKYRKDIIQLYSNTLTNYFKYMRLPTEPLVVSSARQQLLYSGWKSILQVLAMMYLVNMNTDQLEVYLERSYVLFNEYVEKIYTKDFGKMHNPSMFVQKVLVGNISLNAYTAKISPRKNETTYFVTKLSKWSELILAWNNKCTTVCARIHLNSEFTTPLLNLFLDEKYYHIFRVIETLQSSFDEEVYSERHSILLTSLYTYFSSCNRSITQDDVRNIMFRTFFRDRDILEEKFMRSTTAQTMDELVYWIFSNE
jgi:hypothetical protein